MTFQFPDPHIDDLRLYDPTTGKEEWRGNLFREHVEKIQRNLDALQVYMPASISYVDSEIADVVAGGINFGVPSATVNAGDSASEGVSTNATRADHQHAVATASASTLSGSNAEGSSTSLARADHNHALGGSVSGVLEGSLPSPGLNASVAGAGLTESSDVLAVGAGTDITVNANDVQIASATSAKFPTTDEKAALPGTFGTVGSSNKYVTDTDPRISAATPALSDAILALGPSLYWTLGSGGSGLTDQSGNGNTGTGNGGVTIGGGASLTSDGGASTDFDNSNDYISSSYAPFVASSVRTFVGFASADTSADFNTLFGGSGAAGPRLLHRASGNNDVAWIGASGIITENWVNAWPGNGVATAWALVFDDASNSIELFINGVSKGVKTHSEAYSSPGNFMVGMWGSGPSHPFDGQMAHVAVYEKELSAASIAWIATIGLGRLGARDWGLVTALPSPAIPGDRCTYIADSTNGVYWELIYDGSGSYPWKKIGGPPLFAEVTTTQSTSATHTTYQALSTAGPSITVPLAGDYDVEIGHTGSQAAGSSGVHSYDIGGTGAVDADAVLTNRGDGGSRASGARPRRKTGLSASTALVSKYKSTTAAAAEFRDRWMRVDPVRVG